MGNPSFLSIDVILSVIIIVSHRPVNSVGWFLFQKFILEKKGSAIFYAESEEEIILPIYGKNSKTKLEKIRWDPLGMNLQNLALESAESGTVTNIVRDRTNPRSLSGV